MIKDGKSVVRLAIVHPEMCKPNQCLYECKKACPVNRSGKQCIVIGKICEISELLCIGCSACVKKCPFKAIQVINLPTNIDVETIHRYSKNGFKFHRLPVLKLDCIVGMVGMNGIGKSTVIKVLANKIKPNLGKVGEDQKWSDIISQFKGSELHEYFTKVAEGRVRISYKLQYIDLLPKIVSKKYKRDNVKVVELLFDMIRSNCPDISIEVLRNDIIGDKDYAHHGDFSDDLDRVKYYSKILDIHTIIDKTVNVLSGGELQRLFICLCCLNRSDAYFFDEPSSYLDVRQRVAMAKVLRSLKGYVLLVEHDLSILDLTADYGCILYGIPGAYGIVTKPYTIKNAINLFLDGYIPTENMRFRSEELKFRIPKDDYVEKTCFEYEDTSVTYPGFNLKIAGSKFGEPEIILLLGENGMGKTTFINKLNDQLGIHSDDGEVRESFEISIKPQKILHEYNGTVKDLFLEKIKHSFLNHTFYKDVIKPLKVDYLLNMNVNDLSGGELQRIEIILCLGKPAQIYMLDEPSAYLDCDQRIIVSKVLRKFIYSGKKTAFVVEHDLMMGTFLGDKVIVFSGVPGKESEASPSLGLEEGMNKFLKSLDITFRRDINNNRPRINKVDSAKDREQKKSGRYFF